MTCSLRTPGTGQLANGLIFFNRLEVHFPLTEQNHDCVSCSTKISNLSGFFIPVSNHYVSCTGLWCRPSFSLSLKQQDRRPWKPTRGNLWSSCLGFSHIRPAYRTNGRHQSEEEKTKSRDWSPLESKLCFATEKKPHSRRHKIRFEGKHFWFASHFPHFQYCLVSIRWVIAGNCSKDCLTWTGTARN